MLLVIMNNFCFNIYGYVVKHDFLLDFFVSLGIGLYSFCSIFPSQ